MGEKIVDVTFTSDNAKVLRHHTNFSFPRKYVVNREYNILNILQIQKIEIEKTGDNNKRGDYSEVFISDNGAEWICQSLHDNCRICVF